MDAAQGTAPQSHPFTCNSCQVAFRSSEAQRSHMRSDWHRYNLKRRVASLQPLSSEVFNEKVLTAQATTNAAAAKATFEKTCTACQKTYFSENAYQNHIGSQKHKLKAGHQKHETDSMTGSMVSSAFSLGEPINTKTPTNTDEDAEKEFEKVVDGIKQTSIQDKEPGSRRPSRPHHSAGETRPEHPLSSTSTTPATSEAVDEPMEEHPLSRCLFCNYDSPTMKLSVLHMSKIHGLFIPEQKYLTDLESLLRYLQTKIHLNNECIYCHKLKTTTSGIQTHMRDKGHCMIAFETSDEMVEIGQFYDFSSTYSDDEEADEDWESEDTEMEGGARMHEGGTADDGWETDSSASSLDSNEVSAVPIDDHSHQYSKLPLHRHHSHSDPRPHKNADGFHSHAHSHSHAAFYSDFELHLPSGRTAGHRSLNRYFRQNLHSYPSEAERQERAQRLLTDAEGDTNMEDSDDRPRDRNGALITRSNAGMLGVTEAQKRVVRAAEKRDKRVEQKERSRYQAKLEKQHNYQKHFRDPLLQ